MRLDSQIAHYQTADSSSVSYAIQCTSGTMAYADFPAGYYDCWAPAGAAGEHFRWRYIDMPNPASPPTLSIGLLVAPTPAASSQGVQPIAMAPATGSPIRLYVEAGKRLCILYSAAGPVTLYCVRVL